MLAEKLIDTIVYLLANPEYHLMLVTVLALAVVALALIVVFRALGTAQGCK